jgi:hypothetical protein
MAVWYRGAMLGLLPMLPESPLTPWMHDGEVNDMVIQVTATFPECAKRGREKAICGHDTRDDRRGKAALTRLGHAPHAPRAGHDPICLLPALGPFGAGPRAPLHHPFSIHRRERLGLSLQLICDTSREWGGDPVPPPHYFNPIKPLWEVDNRRLLALIQETRKGCKVSAGMWASRPQPLRILAPMMPTRIMSATRRQVPGRVARDSDIRYLAPPPT